MERTNVRIDVVKRGSMISPIGFANDLYLGNTRGDLQNKGFRRLSKYVSQLRMNRKGEIELGIYSVGWELRVLTCSGIITLVDNSLLIDNLLLIDKYVPAT